jgi:hypothetical protein
MPDEKTITEEKPTVVSYDFDGNPTPPELRKAEDKTIVEDKKPDSGVNTEEKKPEETPKGDEYDDLDEEAYLKDFGWQDKESGKKELETLRTRAKELELTNEESRKIATYIKEGKTKELYQFLHKQEQIERLVTSDLSDKKMAAELVKFGISNKNENLLPDEVDFLFDQKFSIPAKPSQGDAEADEDYEERVKVWKTQVANVEKMLVIEAKLAQPELQKLKAEIKLQDIVKTEQQKYEPTPEELANAQKGRDLFLQDAQAGLQKFDGFTVAYKDKDVDVQTSYKLSDDENKVVASYFKEFAEKGYDANAIFGKRWVKNGEFDFVQMAKDLAALETEDKRAQKYLADSKAQIQLQLMKGKRQIDLNTGNGNGELQLEDKERQKKNEDAIWN